MNVLVKITRIVCAVILAVGIALVSYNIGYCNAPTRNIIEDPNAIVYDEDYESGLTIHRNYSGEVDGWYDSKTGLGYKISTGYYIGDNAQGYSKVTFGEELMEYYKTYGGLFNIDPENIGLAYYRDFLRRFGAGELAK